MRFLTHRLAALLLAAALASLSGCSCGEPPPPPVALVVSALRDCTAASPYSTSVSAKDGTPPYTFTAQGVPSGLVMHDVGALSGAATAGGVFTLQVTVTDAKGQTDSATFPL